MNSPDIPTTARAILLAFCLATGPGCLAAAALGYALVVSTDTEAEAAKKKARLEFVEKRCREGASTTEIIQEIKLLDPEWYEEIEEGGL